VFEARLVRRVHPGLTLDVAIRLGRECGVVFGPSGAGKTTLLRLIAGLARAESGRVQLGGDVLYDSDRRINVPMRLRRIGLIYQDDLLFPHLTVAGNLRYGMKRVAPATRRVDLSQAADLLGIGHLLERMPVGLSGGEKQRVGIARALLTSPRLLLLDEPLASLDQKRKLEILPYLERLHDELDIPVLYISHAPEEVARLADHLVLLDNGRAVASGPIGETLARLDLPVAMADDASVVI